MPRTLHFLLGLMMLSLSATAQYSSLDQTIPRLMEAANVPGMTIAVIDGGRVAYGKSFGLRSMDGSAKVTDATVFDAASLSKPLFAYAVMQLAEEGRFNLDKPLAEYFEYPDLAHDERYRKITARMVLSHTSGLPNWRRGRLDFSSDPGERFSYSGEGFVLLQKTIERIMGQDLETLMQQRVLKPLGMKRSSYVWKTDFDDNFAIPHDELGVTQRKRKPESPNAAYSLQTTAPDYARFVISLLNGIGIRQPTIDGMLTETVKVPAQESNEVLSTSVGWGLGWGLQQTSLGQAFWHWGDNGPFRCFVMAYPGQKKAMVFFTNSVNGLSFVDELAQEVFGVPCPACNWIDYPKYDQPTFGLFREITEQGLEAAMSPFMAPNGRHQNTSAISEGQMNALGYRLLRAKYFGEAKKIFEMNMRAFPNSSNVYDSFAEACLRNGETDLAIENYRKAWEKDSGNQTAKSVLDHLTGRAKGNVFFNLDGYSEARHVALAGEFNGWSDLNNPFRRKDGVWTASAQLEPGAYEYKFVVDGVWIPDPSHALTTGEANHNSIVEVGGMRYSAGRKNGSGKTTKNAPKTKNSTTPATQTVTSPRQASGPRRIILPSANISPAQGLIDLHAEAAGGKEAWAGLETLEISLEDMDSPGNIGVRMFIKKPDKIRIDLDNSANKLMKIWDGEKGTVSVNYRPQRMGKGEVMEMKEEVNFFDELMFATEHGYLTELLGEEELDGLPVKKIKLTKPEIEDEQIYYLDAETNLPVMIEEHSQDENFKGVLFRTKLSDYRMVDGLAFPHKMQLLANDRVMWTREVTKVKVNPRMEDKIFEVK